MSSWEKSWSWKQRNYLRQCPIHKKSGERSGLQSLMESSRVIDYRPRKTTTVVYRADHVQLRWNCVCFLSADLPIATSTNWVTFGCSSFASSHWGSCTILLLKTNIPFRSDMFHVLLLKHSVLSHFPEAPAACEPRKGASHQLLSWSRLGGLLFACRILLWRSFRNDWLALLWLFSCFLNGESSEKSLNSRAFCSKQIPCTSSHLKSSWCGMRVKAEQSYILLCD